MRRRSDDSHAESRQSNPIRTLADLAGLRSDAHVTVVRTGGLGDTILVLPALVVLREAYPHGTFALVGTTWAEALQPLLPFAVRTVHIDRVFPPSRRGGRAASIFEASSAVIVYTAAPDGEFVSYVRKMCPGPVVVWPVDPAPDMHAARHLAGAAASAMSVPDTLPWPSLRCSHEDRLRGRSWLDREMGRGSRPLAVHAGSGGRWKCWPARRFADLIARLQVPVLLVEGPADSAVCRELAEALPASAALACASHLPLPRLAGVLAECRGYVGNDSGLSHLAGALGMPTLAVFGPTDPAVWAPRGPDVSLVTARGRAAWPTVDEVVAAARALLDARATAEGAP